MVAMDTKFGRSYCAISDVRNLVYFQLQLPQNFTNRNETCGLKSYIKELMGVYKSLNLKFLLLHFFNDFLKFNHVINVHILHKKSIQIFWRKI